MDRSRVIQPLAAPSHGFMVVVGLLAPIALAIATAQAGATVGLAAVGLAWLYGFIGVRWQRGLYGLLIYLPFAGVVTLALYPWWAPLLFKDVLFLVPAYVGFFALLGMRRGLLRGLPRLPVALMIVLGALVVIQMANPGVENILMALIGLKVWLFYLPMFFLSFAIVASTRDLFVIVRLLSALALIPSTIGVAEALLVQVGDYQSTMEAIYGEVADLATQGFAQFDIGSGMLARVPSTFTFVTQYFGYTLAMLAPCYAVWRGDPSPGWRRAGLGALIVVALASFLSGARAAFFYVPLELGLMFGFERGLSGLVRSGTYTVGLLFGALAVLRVAGSALYEHVAELVVSYARDIVYGGLVQAIVSAPLGAGTGTNTGPARYAFVDPDSFAGIENYYAKAAYELGLPGLFVVVSLFFTLVFLGYRSHRRLKSLPLRSCSAGFLAFLVLVIVNSFKGWLIDLDPVNVYLWIFAGVLMKLPAVDSMIEKRPGTAAWPVPSPCAAASAGLPAYETKRKA